ncbi:SLBB domain-containing protein [Dokdonia sp. R78006]|uniref:SLBB domain-containing protein n=1 Tax=Dokdonia sp. R78006 TaxID=3093866 RepID=UPI0036D20F10
MNNTSESMTISKKLISVFAICFVLIATTKSYSQTVEDINAMPSQDVQSLISKAKASGYTPEQLKALALSKGLSQDQVNALVGKVGENQAGNQSTPDNLAITPNTNVDTSLDNTRVPKKSTLFGYDFFNNPNISFQPNVNLATPVNYQLGPGDGLVISLWGAAENTYDLVVNRNGSVKIPNVGQVLVSGLTMEEASSKIKSKLLNVYRGISAPNSSPYKIFTDISLSSVRTVQVNIIGEVAVPGTYSLSALSTVLNALYAVGGPTDQGTFREIKLVRNGVEMPLFDIYDYLINGSQVGNVTLRDQDVIIVKPYISKINITGSVKRPGVYEIKKSEKFSDLLKYVSGFTSNAFREIIKLERIQGDRKVLKEISLNDFRNEQLFDGDVITVGSIIDKVENRVTINGAVYRPGDYEYTSNMSLQELLSKASGLKETAYLDRVVITSNIEGQNSTSQSYSLTTDGDIYLKVNDVVNVFDKNSVRELGTITIGGAVKNPKTISYIEGVSLEELVIMAGGYEKEADARVIDVTREVIDDDYKTVSETFKISAEGGLDVNTNTTFVFEPNDKITVRYLKGSGDRIAVSVTGEVLYPGSYDVSFKNERILDLVNKAGGLSPYAFEQGGSLVRKNPYYKEVIQQLTSDNVNDSTATKNININLNNLEEYRVGIDFKKLLKEGETSKNNMILKDGDRLIIPSIKQTIKVEGEVMLPSLVRYDKSISFKEYISKSGGFNSKALKRKSYVIYANGDIKATKNFLFFKSYPSIEPGALVIVPAKKERAGGISTQEILGISTGFATLGLLMERLFSN